MTGSRQGEIDGLISRETHWALTRGEALAVLTSLRDACVDVVVIDPSYSSGGFSRGDRSAASANKYTIGGTQIERPGHRPAFDVRNVRRR
jgi:hypothetical protein